MWWLYIIIIITQGNTRRYFNWITSGAQTKIIKQKLSNQKYISSKCIFTFFESLIILTISVCSQILHKFLPSKALQEIFSPPNSLAERGQTASVLWGTQIIAQGAPKTFLSTCPSDKHYFKFGCSKPKGSCPKNFAQNSETIGHIFYCLLSHNQPFCR